MPVLCAHGSGLDESSPRSSVPSEVGVKKSLRFNLPSFGYGSFNPVRSFLSGVRKGYGRFKSPRQSLTSDAPKTAFAEDLKSFKKTIFDPQDKFLLQMNKFFFLSCIFAVAVDPLFFFLPIIDELKCIGIDKKLAVTSTIIRTILDLVYLVRVFLQFRTAYVAPSSRVFGTGELVIDPKLIAVRYLKSYFIMDFFALIPLPQNSEVKNYPQNGYFFMKCKIFDECGTLGQGLTTSTHPVEVLFSITICVVGLILFALLIGNMQAYLQSVAIRLEEMRVKKHDAEQWMHHRALPPQIRERVRRHERYRWLETRGVDEENLIQTLPKDLRRDIKRHLCLGLVKRVPLFENMDERLLDAICERLRPALYTEHEYILREGDLVDEMHFILHGCLESVTTDGGRSGFFNKVQLKEGSFCGDELLTWALDPKSAANFPASTRTVRALTEVEAFALCAEELKFVAGQFRRMHSRQVQHTFRFYSQHWRTWAACFIQAAWRRYYKRKMAEQHRREEEAVNWHSSSSSSRSSLAATIFASRFAANALRGVHRLRSKGGGGSTIVRLPKPPEPDFAIDEADFVSLN
ncbi:hypothetical protein GUJ93_ZPchr0458g22802 [Zizania palustris]|uniref:Cyclic nucleotide-binding domain-containing protein n=1 Tax=Zizania palustris TaxID=103762 RepID=A0A8J5QV57_ZIZPA|nr:hypothetical protein GUJ93_ZPchr0458g22802 [Zizania palustris]